MMYKMNVYSLLFTFLIAVSTVKAQIKFDFPHDEFDFGTVEEGEMLSHSFEFTNTGKDTIFLKDETRDVRPGCGCTSSDFTRTPVAPGAKGYIKAGFNTAGRSGGYVKNITVSQKGTPYKTLAIKLFVVKKPESKAAAPESKKVAVMTLDKKSHDFGATEKGKTVSYRFTIKNAGKDTLKILSAHAACQCITYKLLQPKTQTEEKSVLPGKQALLEVHYTPAAPFEMMDSKTMDILTLFTNDPKNPKTEITLTSDLQNNAGAKPGNK